MGSNTPIAHAQRTHPPQMSALGQKLTSQLITTTAAFDPERTFQGPLCSSSVSKAGRIAVREGSAI
jgi:hypothetical protein